MKTEIYTWRLSAQRKAQLEEEARRKGTSVSALLDSITHDWLARRSKDDDAEHIAIRKRAASAIGALHGGDPDRSTHTRETVREIITRKHAEESHASRRSD